ncbi:MULTISPECIES: MaoC/PaaZ C-terminal domain-containing protein [Bhargavaea]|uniref:MaoC/PaaZ C-terminal domain-containing protein n=1 Tax=Bhargavaea changchunensis TaxID=2134037 RepID=A0ABW2NAR4_9BACL|nr:MaoC/PaaZ C-terminal domain-containing protein [Bhargavaea sp. CC-171006]
MANKSLSEKERTSRVIRVSQEQVNAFAEATGGTGAIHTDPVYAANTPFGKPLVHGLLLLVLIEQEVEALFEREAVVYQVTFIKPIVINQEFTIHITNLMNKELKVSIEADGETMVIGKVQRNVI